MTLRALVICLCALALLTGAAAAQPREAQSSSTPSGRAAATKPRAALPTKAALAAKLDQARKHRGTLRFFESRPHLLRSPTQRSRARATIRRAERNLARTTRDIAWIRKVLRAQQARRLASLPPKAAICNVFREHCNQALQIAWCESRLDTNARNGQYLGLFQMGAHERRLFGHGETALEQARAAHRYFVLSGRDWSPWSCRWAAY